MTRRFQFQAHDVFVLGAMAIIVLVHGLFVEVGDVLAGFMLGVATWHLVRAQ